MKWFPVPEKIGRSLEVDEAKQLIISAVEARGWPGEIADPAGYPLYIG